MRGPLLILHSEDIAAYPPQDDRPEIGPNDARMLHVFAATHSELPVVESRPPHRDQIRHGNNHKGIESKGRDETAVQKMIKRALRTACRTIPTGQPVEQALRHPNGVRGVETIIKPPDRQQTEKRSRNQQQPIKPHYR